MAISFFSKGEVEVPHTDIPEDIFSGRVIARIADYGDNSGIENADDNGHIDIAELDEAGSVPDPFVEDHRPKPIIKSEPLPLVEEQPAVHPEPVVTVAERIGPDAHYQSHDKYYLWPGQANLNNGRRPDVGNQKAHRKPGLTALRGQASALSVRRVRRRALSSKEHLPHVSMRGLSNNAKLPSFELGKKVETFGRKFRGFGKTALAEVAARDLNEAMRDSSNMGMGLHNPNYLTEKKPLTSEGIHNFREKLKKVTAWAGAIAVSGSSLVTKTISSRMPEMQAQTTYKTFTQAEKGPKANIHDQLSKSLSGLIFNTIDQPIISAFEKLGRLGNLVIQGVNPVEHIEYGERKLRQRAKIALGGVALFGIVVVSNRVGLTHESQHIAQEIYGNASGHASHFHEHTHTATHAPHIVNHQPVSHGANHTKDLIQHSNTAGHKAASHDHIKLHKSDKPENAYSFNAYSGDGVIKEIEKYGTTHGKHINAQKAFNVYLNLKSKLGGHLAVRQYVMPDGNIGLLKGHNALTRPATELLNRLLR